MNPTQESGSDRQLALGVYTKLVRCANAVTRKIHHHLADDGLTTSQFGVLEALQHLGPMCQRDLAGKLLKSGGNITLVVENLARRGLINRQQDPTDKRYQMISMSQDGADLIRRVFDRHARITHEVVSVLSKTDQERLSELLRRLGRYASSMDGQD